MKDPFKTAFLFLSSLFFMLSSTTITAQSEVSTATKDTLLVGIAGSEPFVFTDENSPSGIAIEIWEGIANEKNWNYKYKSYDTVESALHALKNNRLDLVVGPISITSERLKDLSFSQPFYNSSLAIVSRAEVPSLWQRIKPLFSLKLIIAVLIFVFILSIVGTLLWLAERKASPEQFPGNVASGIGNGMWLAIVTMTTVGYGDKAPVTLAGRIIAGSWMVISIIFATSMVAGIASTLTLSTLGDSTISKVEELSGRKTASITGSPSLAFLKSYKTKISGVNSLNEAMMLLEDKKVDAVVYDRPQLLYYMKNHPNEKLFIAQAEYYKQGYGFAFPRNSALVYDVNRALLNLAETLETTKIIEYYLDKDE